MSLDKKPANINGNNAFITFMENKINACSNSKVIYNLNVNNVNFGRIPKSIIMKFQASTILSTSFTNCDFSNNEYLELNFSQMNLVTFKRCNLQRTGVHEYLDSTKIQLVSCQFEVLSYLDAVFEKIDTKSLSIAEILQEVQSLKGRSFFELNLS